VLKYIDKPKTHDTIGYMREIPTDCKIRIKYRDYNDNNKPVFRGYYTAARANLIVLGAKLVDRTDVHIGTSRVFMGKREFPVFSNSGSMDEVYLAAGSLVRPNKNNPDIKTLL